MLLKQEDCLNNNQFELKAILMQPRGISTDLSTIFVDNNHLDIWKFAEYRLVLFT